MWLIHLESGGADSVIDNRVDWVAVGVDGKGSESCCVSHERPGMHGSVPSVEVGCDCCSGEPPAAHCVVGMRRKPVRIAGIVCLCGGARGGLTRVRTFYLPSPERANRGQPALSNFAVVGLSRFGLSSALVSCIADPSYAG